MLRSKFPALLGGTLFVWSSACAEVDRDPGLDSELEPLTARAVLSDLERCGDLRHDTLERACDRADESASVLGAPLTATNPRRVWDARTFGVRMTDVDGAYEGVVSFRPPRDGEYVFYLGTPNVPFEIKAGTESVPLTCSRYVAGLEDGCEELRGAYVVSLHSGTNYRVEFGPSSVGWTRLHIRRRRLAGEDASDPRLDCVSEELSGLARVCDFAADSVAINPGTLGELGTPVATDTSYGVRMIELGGAREGSLSFTPPYTSDYVLYLNTPTLPVAVQADDNEVAASCGAWISDELATEAIGETCDPIRAAIRFPSLSGGVEHRIELGRTDQAWVRAVLVPTAPDSDNDGVSDEFDECPDDPSLTDDSDDDGLCGDDDPCPADANNDVDGDGICGDVDNCPEDSNEDQADGDGDLIGDACDPSTSVTLGDLQRCGPARLDKLDFACERTEFTQALTATALQNDAGPRYIEPNRVYGVRLRDRSDGTNAGRLRFRNLSSVPREYLFYLGTPNIPFDIVGPDAEVPPKLCSQYIGDDVADACREYRGAYAVVLQPRTTYTLTLGPAAPQSWTRLFVTDRTDPGVVPDHLIACDEGDLASMTEVCPIADDTTSINAGNLGSLAPPAIETSTAYGVHLFDDYAVNEGSFTFVPPYTSDYMIYLGTPNMPLAVSLDGEPVAGSCGDYITDELATNVTGAPCSPLQAGHRFGALEGGRSYRIELGPIAPQEWVRLVVEPTDPDSDGDGVSDALDECPTHPSATEDIDGDGLCGTEDPCPQDALNDADGDGWCESEDNCPATTNPAQSDADGDGIGDDCDNCDGPGLDPDADALCDGVDNCPDVNNPDQADEDGDGRGDVCDDEFEIVLLQDLSGSFGNDIDRVSERLTQLHAAVNECGDARFGLGSYIDKPFSPFGSTTDYSYRADLGLTTDLAELQVAYDALALGAGRDGPEAQLTALLHAAHDAQSFYGFQPTLTNRKVLVLFTDAPAHVAGDCSDTLCTSGANNGDAVLDDLEDYPSVAQVGAQLQAAELEVVFAVTSGHVEGYQAVLDELGVPGRVVTLSSDSSNVTEAVLEGLDCPVSE
ncbi:MAG: hypothetical protein B7733_22945 [Myxococcales bacterium FL481]|nr:MAG: hypothetical protein B7733_22945 [Myxococcales bacterium FL481]